MIRYISITSQNFYILLKHGKPCMPLSRTTKTETVRQNPYFAYWLTTRILTSGWPRNVHSNIQKKKCTLPKARDKKNLTWKILWKIHLERWPRAHASTEWASIFASGRQRSRVSFMNLITTLRDLCAWRWQLRLPLNNHQQPMYPPIEFLSELTTSSTNTMLPSGNLKTYMSFILEQIQCYIITSKTYWYFGN